MTRMRNLARVDEAANPARVECSGCGELLGRAIPGLGDGADSDPRNVYLIEGYRWQNDPSGGVAWRLSPVHAARVRRGRQPSRPSEGGMVSAVPLTVLPAPVVCPADECRRKNWIDPRRHRVTPFPGGTRPLVRMKPTSMRLRSVEKLSS